VVGSTAAALTAGSDGLVELDSPVWAALDRVYRVVADAVRAELAGTSIVNVLTDTLAVSRT
jgi:hypothetical protein